MDDKEMAWQAHLASKRSHRQARRTSFDDGYNAGQISGYAQGVEETTKSFENQVNVSVKIESLHDFRRLPVGSMVQTTFDRKKYVAIKGRGTTAASSGMFILSGSYWDDVFLSAESDVMLLYRPTK